MTESMLPFIPLLEELLKDFSPTFWLTTPSRVVLLFPSVEEARGASITLKSNGFTVKPYHSASSPSYYLHISKEIHHD